LPKAHMPHSLNHRHAEHAFQQRSGHPHASRGGVVNDYQVQLGEAA